MACTTSIGPGATNLVTAAALAHVNRLPVLLLPGDIFVSRAPDPVLQQVEDFADGTVSANDCFRPVSRYFDRIVAPGAAADGAAARDRGADRSGAVRPGDAGVAAGRAGGGVRLSGGVLRAARRGCRAAPRADAAELDAAAALLRAAKQAADHRRRRRALQRRRREALARFADAHGVPVAETQAGKGALPWDHPLQAGAIGVTGATAANALARDADVVLAVGTRLQDFTTGSHALFESAARGSSALNVQPLRCASSIARCRCVGDARAALDALDARARRLARRRAWSDEARDARRRELARRPPRACDVRDQRAGAALRARGDRRRAAHRAIAGGRHRRLRRRHAAGRAAQAVARRRARRLSRGIRLFVHGLRDRRRPRRQDGAARARSGRDGRRRQLPDDELRDRDVGDARARSSSSSCSTIAASAASTGCSRRPAARAFNNLLDDCAGTRRAGDRFRRARARRWARIAEQVDVDRRAGGGARASARGAIAPR